MAIILGTEGADTLGKTGVNPEDIIIGFGGDDDLYGSDKITFIFRQGDGNDTYYPSGHNDEVTFRFSDIASTAPLALFGGAHQHITLHYTDNDSITMGYFAWGYRPAKFEFSDRVTLTAEQLLNKINKIILVGTEGNDTLAGLHTNDVLGGGAGNDILKGASGSDVYAFRQGDGKDRIDELLAENTGKNTILFVDVKSTDKLTFQLNQDGNVVIGYGTNDNITINSREDMQISFSDGIHRSLSELIKQNGITTSGTINKFPNYKNPSEYHHLHVIDNLSDSVKIIQEHDNYSVLVAISDYKLDGSIDRSKVSYINHAKELPYFIDALATRAVDKEIGKSTTVTYSFATENTNNLSGFTHYSEADKQHVRHALSAWSDVSGVTFKEVADSASVGTRFFRHDLADEDPLVAGYAYADGNVHIRNTYSIRTQAGGYDHVLVHEIGHVLGLKHPGEYDASDEKPFLSPNEENKFYTIMSYNSTLEHGDPALYEEAGPRILDVAAIQYLYGVNKSQRIGNDIYSLKDIYIWDGNGNDTLDASKESANVYLDLNPGSWIYRGSKKSSLFDGGQAFIGFGTEIENAIGSKYNDQIIGNDKSNIINGGAGADTLSGGKGDDHYYVDNAGDKVIEKANEGRDTVFSAIHYDLSKADNIHIENAILIGTANAGLQGNNEANLLKGNVGNNHLKGLAGNDWLEGGAGDDILNGNAGADRMIGGTGNDVYYVDNRGDVVVEEANGGRDTVNVFFDYDLMKVAHIENAILIGTANAGLQGNNEANLLKGNAGNNHLKGLAGNDWLEGGAGDDILNGNAGADRMIGGTGNDVYYVDNRGDVVVEEANGGRDTVNVFFDYDLMKVAHIENAIAIGAGEVKLQGSGEANLLKGNGRNNSLVGLGGNDWLDGGAGNDVLVGGSGKDTLVGGAGKDIFKFGSINDSRIELKDVIIDFKSGEDKIDLSVIDANTTQSGNQAFSFIGAVGFSAAGQVRFTGGVVYGDVNGDKQADFAIELKNVTTLQAGDFIL